MIQRIVRRISDRYEASSRQDALSALYLRRYEIALGEERWDTALVFLDRLLELRPRSTEVRLARARLFEAMGDPGRAIDAYLRLLPLAEAENPAAASIVRASLDRLFSDQAPGALEAAGTSSTDVTLAASLPEMRTSANLS